MAGLNQVRGNYVVIMDDDFQNPVSGVIQLLDFAINHDVDVTYSFYKRKKHSWFRNLGSRFNDLVGNIVLKKPKELYLSSFKVLNRFLVDEIIRYDKPYPYVDGLVLRTTSKIARVEVDHEERRSGKSGYTLAKLIRLWLNMFTSFSILPLRIAVVLGMIFSGLGLGFGIFTVIEKLSNPDLPIGYATIIVVISILAGIQLLSLGLIGEYVGRIFLTLNRKPQYTIRKRFDKKKGN
jgi:undecaprenyl-phosphate 4-deoxy-4-formamido-L-arabinose transferase